MAAFAILSSNPEVQRTNNLHLHTAYKNVPGIHVVQITVRDSEDVAAARIDVASSAQVIDISISYLAKEASRRLAGSASLQYSDLVKQILTAAVNPTDVPATLKIRIDWVTKHSHCV